MKEKQLHGEELTKEDLKRAVKDEAYRKKLRVFEKGMNI